MTVPGAEQVDHPRQIGWRTALLRDGW